MKIQLTSKKQAAEMKAASLEPKREMEEDASWPADAEEEAAISRRLPDQPAAKNPAADDL